MPERSSDRQVRELVEPALGELGIVLVDVAWQPGRRGPVLRLTVDSSAGVTLDDCGRASEVASRILDQYEERFPDRYQLEVSSPGAERALASDADYLASLGRRIKLTLRSGEGRMAVEGKLVAVGADDLQLQTRRSRSGKLRDLVVPRAEVISAQVVVDL